jgi:hypothetical protein
MSDEEHLKMVIASLESKVDLLEAELAYLNQLLLRFGFPEGIDSLKLAIEELLDDGEMPPPPPPHRRSKGPDGGPDEGTRDGFNGDSDIDPKS